ncbi:hypothetical protein K438DRAFT_1938441 [Mycena galopus ATCC 62051]|nr:hypothetical protein K438DRAFT_1938441 [Mycena galopus ATCC 62051]
MSLSANPLLFAPLTISLPFDLDLRSHGLLDNFGQPSGISVTRVANHDQSYDALLNAAEEYYHIWKSKWSLIKCLYLWSRYGPFIDTTISVLRGGGVISDLLHSASLTQALTNCNTLNKFNTVFSIFGIGVTEGRHNLLVHAKFS